MRSSGLPLTEESAVPAPPSVENFMSPFSHSHIRPVSSTFTSLFSPLPGKDEGEDSRR